MGLDEKSADIVVSSVLLAGILSAVAVSLYRDWLKSRGRFKAIMVPLSPVRALDVVDLSYEAFQREARAVDVFDEAALERFLAKWRGRVPERPSPVVSNLERITVKADGKPIIDVPAFDLAGSILGGAMLGGIGYLFGRKRG